MVEHRALAQEATRLPNLLVPPSSEGLKYRTAEWREHWVSSPHLIHQRCETYTMAAMLIALATYLMAKRQSALLHIVHPCSHGLVLTILLAQVGEVGKKAGQLGLRCNAMAVGNASCCGLYLSPLAWAFISMTASNDFLPPQHSYIPMYELMEVNLHEANQLWSPQLDGNPQQRNMVGIQDQLHPGPLLQKLAVLLPAKRNLYSYDTGNWKDLDILWEEGVSKEQFKLRAHFTPKQSKHSKQVRWPLSGTASGAVSRR